MDTLTLRFDGAPSIAAARKAMRAGSRVDIELPLETHHALYRHLNPDASGGPDEEIDADDGAELLERIATVAGLGELGTLAPALKAGGYRVELSGPDPVLSLLPPAKRAKATAAARRAAGRSARRPSRASRGAPARRRSAAPRSRPRRARRS